MANRIEPETYIMIGIPVLFLIGSLFHFLFSISGKRSVVGMFTPVNESVFEHTKMVVLPTLLWWGLIYLYIKDGLHVDTWFTAMLLSMFTAIISIPMLYYFYTNAFGTESLVVDILILLVAVGLGQLLGLHYYHYGKGINCRLALVIMVAVIVLYAVLTIVPPKLPLFQDMSNGSYGISK